MTLQEKFSNEDTLKQPLHRSKGLLFKRNTEWTDDQQERAKLLFKQFSEIEEAYKYCLRIRKWYEPIRPRYSDRKYKIKEEDLMLITKEGMESKVEEIRNIANFLRSNSTPILRYFYRRESNAKAEALNQNLRRIVSANYGVRNTDFFLYRIALHFS
ncbi:transposase [uncultured Porphyromonas sp.]|uniref:transposase n=1 Tax=uncultured Porphyromonas sp. TaxID=159274 RepID=UPI0026090FAA|nr:transposase [uncultured Porphyromonas sp.]